MATDPRATLVKLLDAFEEREKLRRDDTDALLSELRAIAGGQDGIGVKLKVLKAHWCIVWTERHKEKCSFDHVKHTAWLKKQLGAGFSVDEIAAKMQNYVATEDAYYVRARHPFGLFMTGFNSWRGIPVTAEPAADTTSRLQAARGE